MGQLFQTHIDIDADTRTVAWLKPPQQPERRSKARAPAQGMWPRARAYEAALVWMVGEWGSWTTDQQLFAVCAAPV